ncbi:MAG: GNAT family N-acetyltransferase [Hyphomicrobiales bacterium]|nr:GNAT family N-acetyltransferase [Hyphomicrobiales bacterium]
MIQLPDSIRMGRKDDASSLARLVNYAGEGIPLYLWEKMAENGESGWDIGIMRAERDHGAFSYRNAFIADVDGACAGCLIGYNQPEVAEPIDTAAMPPMFVPLQELENLAPDSWYVNVLAVFPEHRRRGIGRQLLETAEKIGADEGKSGLSVIVSDVNHGARRLYESCGYREIASRPMVKESWVNDGENWLLLTRAYGGTGG